MKKKKRRKKKKKKKRKRRSRKKKKMKLVKWAEQVQDRLKWKDIVEMAKTVSELERHRRRR